MNKLTPKQGRPLVQIDDEQVFKLAGMMATQIEMAAFFDVSVDTIHRRFDLIYREAFGKHCVGM